MTIKKTKKEGGATIADRYRLDAPVQTKPAGGAGLKYALTAGVFGLVIVGILTYMLWKHWEYLMPV